MGKAVSKPFAQNYRYERKFVYTHLLSEDLIELEVLGNSFCFREIFSRRTVNNCYYDDASMSFYHQNVAGDDKRDKYRLRWYGDDFTVIQNPVLEIKKKHGTVGDKLSFPLADVKANLNTTSSSILLELVKTATHKNNYMALSNALEILQPALYNSYERRYFLSDCERYRITVDYNMRFYDVLMSPLHLGEITLPEVILELKYNREDDKESRQLTQQLNARLSKHSKYVRGIDLVHHQNPS